jgi:hypothetical protein
VGQVRLPYHIHTLTAAFEYIEARDRNRELAAQLAAMLRGEYPRPDHFVTLTLKDIIRDGQRIPRGMITLDACWRYFCRSVRKVIGHRFEFVYVVEEQARGVPHIHALTWNTHELDAEGIARDIEECMYSAYGMARIAPVRTTGDPTDYLTKYLFKQGATKLLSLSRGLGSERRATVSASDLAARHNRPRRMRKLTSAARDKASTSGRSPVDRSATI